MMSRFSILLYTSACVVSASGCAHVWQPIDAAPSRTPEPADRIVSLHAPDRARLTEVNGVLAASELRLPAGVRHTLAVLLASHRPWRGTSRLRLAVSLDKRVLSAMAGKDTVFQAPVGVATGLRLAFAGRSWRFRPPRGTRRVLRKTENPVWTPPDWHYAETAYNYGLRLANLPSKGVTLRTGAKLVIRDSVVGIIYPKRGFAMLPTDEHLVFDGRVFIPPVGTLNRRVTAALGDFALDLGGGYLIHGTTNEASIGQASSHGCIRVSEEDIEWLYDNVPVGTRVTIH